MLSTICSTDINNQQLYNVHQIATLLQPQNIKLWHKITTHSINLWTKLGHTETNIGKAWQRGHLIDINTQAGKKSHGIRSYTLKSKACLFGFKLCIQSLKYTCTITFTKIHFTVFVEHSFEPLTSDCRVLPLAQYN